MIELFSDKSQCCGCGACSSICPRSAIRMTEDEYGFVYPHVNATLCVECGVCKQVCAFQSTTKLYKPLKVFGAAQKTANIKQSASGGIATILSEAVISWGGVAFGATLEITDGQVKVAHIPVNSKEDVAKLKGSKYVQSDISSIFTRIKSLLSVKNTVIFIGTPCQVDAVRTFLHTDYDNLFLVDIVCHGVPNVSFFQDYLSYIERIRKGKIKDFCFRDKQYGWGLHASVTYNIDERDYKDYINPLNSSYYSMFLSAETYRQSCYTCKYACSQRCGDITLGDFWGVEKEHKNEIAHNINLNVRNGISLVFVNSVKGLCLWQKCSKETFFFESTLEKTSKYNHQLLSPSKIGKLRKRILEEYKKGSYEAVEKFYRPIIKRKRIISLIKQNIPEPIKNLLKYIIKK